MSLVGCLTLSSTWKSKPQLIILSSYIPLPSKLAAKKVLFNMKNTDQKYFVSFVLSALHAVEKMLTECPTTCRWNRNCVWRMYPVPSNPVKFPSSKS
ncbi:hypothetical protein AVEN_105422-1 [Araneus ventricosus]|uniref:Uncharacterized protein n=1 Tax=Araneus ventricosus TaxID=182803 RepID=A0A4Y2IEV5_ARAVE|nr:hypothetical protein AVEN_105422-1 [Araneus ventricosus]